MIRHLAAPASIALTSMLGVGIADAQLSAWLDFNGQIVGDATDSRHRGWIDIHSFDIESRRELTFSGTGGERIDTKPALSELGLVKSLDRSSPELFRASVDDNQSFPKVTLDLTAGGDRPFARLELEDVLVTGLKFSAHENADRPTELVALSFTRITYLYIMPDGEELFTEYDVEKNVSQSGSNPGGSDPDVDSDKDNMPDWWELEYGFNPGADDSGLDADGDGLTNRQEYELGTNPRSANSIFKASLAPHAEIPGSYRLSWNSVAGKTYVIEWSADLSQPFTAIRTVKATADSTSEAVLPSGNVGFYRVRPQ